jgi:6-phosphofructokinase 1
MLKGNAVVGQSGGPTSVINSSLVGVIDGCRAARGIGRTLGMRWGIEGFIKGQVVDLSAEQARTLLALRRTPSSALGSSRHKVKEADLPVILGELKKHKVRYLFLIGGNDTMDTIHRVTEYASRRGYELRGLGVPKTVDNDLYGTDHTPGYPSAARYLALSVLEAGRLARDMQKVDQFVIFQCIGRDAGWLSAATALAKREPADAPHLIYLPEQPFDRQRFLIDVEDVYKQYGYVSIVCGEGLKYADGTAVSASQVKDKFSNLEFGAMGGASVAMRLHRMISEQFGWRGEFQITESLCMCASDRATKLDLQEAYECGLEAARLAARGESGLMVTLERKAGKTYRSTTGTIPLKEVAARAKPMPPEMINDAGNFPTEKFLDYARPLVGKLPEFADLRYVPAK